MIFKEAALISIGTELLIGQTIDTNSTWIGEKLNDIGIWLKLKIAVGDDENQIIDTLDYVKSKAQLILITGGLGPTSDDITKQTLANYFNDKKMVLDKASLERIKEFFHLRNKPLLDMHIQQAMLPSTCIPIPNMIGTAPAMWFEQNDALYISMPGVPSEMKHIMTHFILPKLGQESNIEIIHKTLLTYGLGESEVVQRLTTFEQSMNTSVSLAYLPNRKFLRLRLTSVHAKNDGMARDRINELFNNMKLILADIVIAENDIPLQEALSKLLNSTQKTIATAESCTGGYLSHLITSIAGSSSYYKGSIVAYDNTIKVNRLNIEEKLLSEKGAVSAEAVEQMAIHICLVMDTHYGVAISGIMGPTGGNDEKPVGTFCIAVANKNGKVISFKHQLHYNRINNIETTAQIALMHAIQFIQEDLVKEPA